MSKTETTTQFGETITTMPIEEWLRDDEHPGAVTVDEHDTIYIIPYNGEDDLLWVCVNTTTQAVWRTDSRMLLVMFKGSHVRPLEVD